MTIMSLKKERRKEVEDAVILAIGTNKKNKPLNQKEIADKSGLSTQSISRIIKNLEQSGRVLKKKDGRYNIYSLPEKEISVKYSLDGLKEDEVYSTHVADFIHDVPKCAKNNFSYAFLEILNNAIEHSNGTEVIILIKRSELMLEFCIKDDGVGVFTKVAESLNLSKKRYAILELAKGKFTSDPTSHSGEGIFFSSKCGDQFTLESDGIIFYANPSAEILLDKHAETEKYTGTLALFTIKMDHQQTMEELFKQYTDMPERYGFSKTAIPIRLLEYGDKSPIFISRSQARRLLARVERFEVVTLDFSGIESIGQGFADEIFRVFKTKYPDVTLTPVNCSDTVNQMIEHVLAYK